MIKQMAEMGANQSTTASLRRRGSSLSGESLSCERYEIVAQAKLMSGRGHEASH